MLADLITLLRRAGIEATGEELAETLWLALQIGTYKGQERVVPTEPQARRQGGESVAGEYPPLPDGEPPAPGGPDPEKTSARLTTSTRAVHVPSPRAASEAHKRGGLPLKSPAAPALADPLGIGRALRPLLRRVPSRTHSILDEAATAQRIAEQRLWLPVLTPVPQRLLELALVVEGSRSMLIWRETIAHALLVFERQGAFRDVRVWQLSSNTDGSQVWIHPGLSRRAQPPGRSPKELLDPRGRRLILLLSDGVSVAWARGTVPELLATWGQRGPVALVQLLPPWLWSRSALGDAIAGRVRAASPAPPNRELDFMPASLLLKNEDIRGGLPLPVVTLERLPLARWAQALTSTENRWAPGYLLDSLATTRALARAHPAAEEDTRSLLPRQRLRRFRATASQTARRLAGLLSAAAPLTIQVIRLIQQTMLPDAQQGHLAEVLLGGLLEQLPTTEEEEPAFDFYAGVRELLLSTLPTSTSLEVLAHVSAYAEARFGQFLDFAALVENPASLDEGVIDERSKPLLRITARVLQRLGGAYASLACTLEEKIAPPPPGDKKGVPPMESRKEVIAAALSARASLARAVEEMQELLRALTSTLQALADVQTHLARDQVLSSRLSVVDFLPARQALETERENLEKLHTRFARKTLTIGVIGRARQGKSLLLQSISGLGAEMIPTDDEGQCTEVRSLISHNPDVSPHGEITFYSEREFLDEVIAPFYRELNLDRRPPATMAEFAQPSLPSLPPQHSTRAVAAYSRLHDYKNGLHLYRKFIGASTIFVPPDEIREYIAHRSLYGQRALCTYLAVKEARITGTFPYDDIGQLALVDTPGPGDSAVGTESRFVRDLDELLDGVLFVRMPSPVGGVLQDLDYQLYDLVSAALHGSPLDHRSFLVLNHIPGLSSGEGDNLAQCQRMRASVLEKKRLRVADAVIADCSNPEEVRHLVLDPLLDLLAHQLGEFDLASLSQERQRLAQLQTGIATLLDKALPLPDLSSLSHYDLIDAQNRFEGLWSELLQGFDGLLVMLREQSTRPDPACVDFFRRLLQRCREDPGIPSIKEIQNRSSTIGSSVGTYHQLLHEMRAHLVSHFIEIYGFLERSLSEVKGTIAEVFLAQGHLTPLIEARGERFFQEMERYFPSDLTHLRRVFRWFAGSRFSSQGFFMQRIRHQLAQLSPDQASLQPLKLPANASHEKRAVFIRELLLSTHTHTLTTIEEELAKYFDEPAQAALAMGESFVDLVVY
ncbi:MAG TPA: SAV_2336 N-terminal domain-related protein, partial [Ktedonobacteraceae bacterium]